MCGFVMASLEFAIEGAGPRDAGGVDEHHARALDPVTGTLFSAKASGAF